MRFKLMHQENDSSVVVSSFISKPVSAINFRRRDNQLKISLVNEGVLRRSSPGQLLMWKKRWITIDKYLNENYYHHQKVQSIPFFRTTFNKLELPKDLWSETFSHFRNKTYRQEIIWPIWKCRRFSWWGCKRWWNLYCSLGFGIKRNQRWKRTAGSSKGIKWSSKSSAGLLVVVILRVLCFGDGERRWWGWRRVSLLECLGRRK